LRAAFGCYGGTAAARADAIPIVRRLQSTDRGFWILCDCRPAAEKPPALVPASETHLRRHVTDNWPQHAQSCEFFREPVEQAEISASYRPLPKPQVRLLRSFDVSSAAPLERREASTPANRRPQLGRLLVRLLSEGGLQRVEAGGFTPQPIPEQLKSIWGVARTISIDRHVRMADAFCMSMAKLPGLMDQIARTPAESYRYTRPHGLLMIRVREVQSGKLNALNGEELSVVGRLAVLGERPEDEPGPDDARSPYVTLCIVTRPTPIDPVQIVSAYVHPCASPQRVMLVDSDCERQTLALLLQFQRQTARRHQAAVIIEKPMESMASETDDSGAPCPPLIPDFIVTARHRDGTERRVIVETMGYADEGYRERKLRLHPEMQRAAGASAVIEHDFQLPGHWPQDWRDNRLRRALWQMLGPQGEAPQP
jgi:hypothetical protein